MITDFTSPTARAPLLLRPGDDAWGPFALDCSQALPEGVTVSSADATAYLDGEEVSDLIEPGSVSVSDGTTVNIKFQATGEVGTGTYYVALELTLTNSAVKHLAFGPVKVAGWP